jgi:hypothetical protein
MKFVPDSPLKITIAVAVAVVGFTASVSWVCANGLRDIKQELSDLRSDLTAQQRQMWTIQDQERWIYALDRANRFSSLEVPQLNEVKTAKKPN